MRNQNKPDESKVYVCATPFAAAGGLGIAQGTRLRGDHRAVREHFQYWVEDGTPLDEWPKPKPVEYYTLPQRQPREIPVERQVRARGAFTGWVDGGHVVVQRGQIFDRDDAVVRKAPEQFETVPQPLEGAVA